MWVVKGWNEAFTDSTARNQFHALLNKWVNQTENESLRKGVVGAATPEPDATTTIATSMNEAPRPSVMAICLDLT